MKILRPGEYFTVLWSNGAGESTYQVVDSFGSGPHEFNLQTEVEYTVQNKKTPKLLGE